MGNQFKTALLLAALTAFIILVGRMIGGRQGMIIAFFLAGGMNFFRYWYSDRMVLRMYRATEVKPHEFPILFNAVQRLAQNAGLLAAMVAILVFANWGAPEGAGGVFAAISRARSIRPIRRVPRQSARA